MVGYTTEDKAYCMELTFNYGLSSYEPGNGLQEFGIFVPDVAAAAKAAQDLKYKVENDVITGPDQYTFRLLKQPEGRTERFSYVLCRSGNVSRSVSFYKEFLGFSDAELPSTPGLPSKAAAVSYTPASHPHGFEPVLLLFYEDGVTPKINPWEGRHAFALEAKEVKSVYEKFKKECPERIMHDNDGQPISLEEKLGTLFIFIAKDPDGYELCLVSRETMLPATIEAVNNYDPKLLDFEARNKRIEGIKEAGKEVEKLIAANPVIMFSKEWCPFCKKAKAALDDVGAKYFVKEFADMDRNDLVPDPMNWQEYLAAKTNMGKSVPKVFIEGVCIGGGDDVITMHKNGSLLRRCVAAGACVEEATGPALDTHYFCNGHLVTQEVHGAHQL
jgi:glutaredoxin 3